MIKENYKNIFVEMVYSIEYTDTHVRNAYINNNPYPNQCAPVYQADNLDKNQAYTHVEREGEGLYNNHLSSNTRAGSRLSTKFIPAQSKYISRDLYTLSKPTYKDIFKSRCTKLFRYIFTSKPS